MKLNSIKISNILSFQNYDDITNAEVISFPENLNILIGPNGSGKSNFLEIINQIFNGGFILECRFNEDRIREYKVNNQAHTLNQTIRNVPKNFTILKQNYESIDKTRSIQLEIEFNKEDENNLEFLISHKDEVNELMGRYSDQAMSINDQVSVSDLTRLSKLKFVFRIDKDQMNLNQTLTDPLENVCFNYLRFFRFFQYLIKISNEYEGKSWNPLKNTFSVIGGSHGFQDISSEVTLQQDREDELQNIYNKAFGEGPRSFSAGEPSIFLIVKDKIIQQIVQKEIEFSKGGKDNEGKRTVDLIPESIVVNINKHLKNQLGLEFNVEKKSGTQYRFYFVNLVKKKEISISDLSSGEKELVNFIFTIFGNDLKNGLMIIDEPELHLHPPLQLQYLDMINNVINELDVQFILATHSPVFVDTDTIKAVYRFYKNENEFTKIVHPVVDEEEKTLIHILNYTNSTKIFFSDKVVLVEGDHDEYFFKVFLDFYRKKNKKITKMEFLNIGGKFEYQKWKTFLDKYGIAVHYIGDLDNIFEFETILDKTTKSALIGDFENDEKAQIQTELSKNSNYRSTKSYYQKFIIYLKTKKTSEWNKIETNIQQVYANMIYILKEGEMEDYLPYGKNKDFQKLIDFCRNNFETWFEGSDVKKEEITKIFDSITAQFSRRALAN